jgi:hypothetical protein
LAGTTDSLPITGTSRSSNPAARIAGTGSGNALAKVVSARTSKPPPKRSGSSIARRNAPDVVAPTTMVNTTSVNIASVTPVRKRTRSGYAIAILSIGASGRMRPSPRIVRPRSASAL